MKRIRVTVMMSILLLCLAVLTSVSVAGDMDEGTVVYKQLKCAKCHGEGGKGDGWAAEKLKAKGKDIEMHDWTDKAFISKQTDEYIKEIIVKGGKAVGKSKHMPKYQQVLQKRNQDVEDLLAFIRSFSQ